MILQDTIKEIANYKIIDFLNKHDLWIPVILIFICGIIIGWIINFLKTKSEIKKLKSDIKLNSLNILEKIYNFKEEYDNNLETVGLYFRNLDDAFKSGDLKKINDNREELILFYHSKVFNSFIKYIDYLEKITDRKNYKDVINNTIFYFLKTSLNYLNFVNLENIIKTLSKSKATISPQNLSQIYSICHKIIPFYNICLKNKLKKYKKWFKEISK